MYPPTHVAFAYLAARKIIRKPLSGVQTWFLGGLALLPDVADKSVHYVMGIFNSGRNMMHSIFFLLFIWLVYMVFRQTRHKAPLLMVIIGIGSHQVGDFIQPWIKSTYTDLSDAPDWYLYPLFPFYDPVLLPWGIDMIGITWESILLVVGMTVWFKDGMPGILSTKKNKKTV
jgi:membrane-bound metal-dependent hydrolase YbcI (DUF457 family)